ncbi:MAG: hypothetical protein LBB26_02365 [Puniceicoccales bacterium]|jgi:hypothetical protein|nr:hypothetical protein [Puniceicoccales bacterium]
MSIAHPENIHNPAAFSATLTQPSGAQHPTASAPAVVVKTVFSLPKKILSLLLWLTLIIPLLAFFHAKITGSPSRLWLFLTWSSNPPQRMAVSPGTPQLPPQAPPSDSPSDSFQSASDTDDESDMKPDAPKPNEENPADDVTIEAPEDIHADDSGEHVQLFDWEKFTSDNVQEITDALLDEALKAELIKHVKWMVAQRWQPEFIRSVLASSINMEKDDIFSSLPEGIVPDKWFLVPRANERIREMLTHQTKGDLGLWTAEGTQALNKCESAYVEFQKNNGLDGIGAKLMSRYAMAGYTRKADGDPFNLLIASTIYPPNTKFHFLEPNVQAGVTTFLNQHGITLDQARNFLAAQYAFAQGMMRHIKKFPGRDGDKISVFRRMWPHGGAPNFIGARYQRLFAGPMEERCHPLQTWDMALKTLHDANPGLIAEDGTLLAADGSQERFKISFAGCYPGESFSIAAPGQKKVGSPPGELKFVELESFGCLAGGAKIPIYAVLEPSCFLGKGSPIEREFILLATQYEATISLFKSNELYNKEAVNTLEAPYPDIAFETAQ